MLWVLKRTASMINTITLIFCVKSFVKIILGFENGEVLPFITQSQISNNRNLQPNLVISVLETTWTKEKNISKSREF